jgi:hypothetical protein
MERPARVPRRHRGLRVVHTVMRIVLVCALVVLLSLIAVREVEGLAAAALPGPAAASTPTAAAPTRTASSAPDTTPSHAAVLAASRGGDQ